MPHELPPPDHLPDEPFRRVERDRGEVVVVGPIVVGPIVVAVRPIVAVRPVTPAERVERGGRRAAGPTVRIGVVRARFDPALRVGRLDGSDRFPRVQQPEVDRGRQQGVREERLVGHHRVLVAAERREPIRDEAVERVERLRAGDRPGELL